jgi:hypothetical protein
LRENVAPDVSQYNKEKVFRYILQSQKKQMYSWSGATSASGMVGTTQFNQGAVGSFKRLAQVGARTIVSIHPAEMIQARTTASTATAGDKLYPLLKSTKQLTMMIGDLVFSRRSKQELLSMGVPKERVGEYDAVDSDMSAFSVFNGKRMEKKGAELMTQDDFRLLYGFRGFLESGPHEICPEDRLVNATVSFMNVTGARIEAGTSMTTFVNLEDIAPHPRIASRAVNRRDAEPLIVRGYFCPVPSEWNLAYELSSQYSGISKRLERGESVPITSSTMWKTIVDDIVYHVRIADSMIVGTCVAPADAGGYGQIATEPR